MNRSVSGGVGRGAVLLLTTADRSTNHVYPAQTTSSQATRSLAGSRFDHRVPGVVCLCVVVPAAGIMMAMSALGSTEEGMGGAGWAINMVMAMFGGAMMPLAFMPPFMQTMSDLSPVKWAILSLEAAIWRNYSLGELGVPWAVLIAIGSVGFAIGLYYFHRGLSR